MNVASVVIRMQKSTQTTPMGHRNKPSSLLPTKIIVVQRIVFIENMEVVSQCLRTFKVIDVNVGTGRSQSLVIIWVCSENNRYDIIPKNRAEISLCLKKYNRNKMPPMTHSMNSRYDQCFR